MTTTSADELLKGCGAMNVCGNGQYCKYCKRVIAQSLAEKKGFLEFLNKIDILGDWSSDKRIVRKIRSLRIEIKKLEEAKK